MVDQSTRREFLSTTAAAAATATWAGGNLSAAGAGAEPGPNEIINLGLIGCGARGPQLIDDFKPVKGCRVIAVCDVNAKRMAAGQARAGGSHVQTYHDYRKLLDSREIDAVIVATNGHWHVLPTIHACQAGKDVYVEKPLGTSVGEGRAAVEAARKYDRVVQIGTQQRSWDHYRKAAEIIQSGRLGHISEVKVWDYENWAPGVGAPPDGDPPPELDWDFWLGPSPNVAYNPNRYKYHYWYYDYGGGWQLDWAVHHYDIVHWFMGVKAPRTATALAGHLWVENDNRECPDTFSGILEYGPGPVAKKGFLLQYTFRGGCRREQRSHGKCFMGTEASLIIDRSGYTISKEPGGNQAGERGESFKSEGPWHTAAFLENLRNRTRPEADVEVGHYATNPGHLMNISYRVGRTVHWDADEEQFIADADANALVTKEYRKPWELEVG